MTTATIQALIATGFAFCMAAPASAQKHVALVLDNGRIQTTAPSTHAARIAEGLERMHYRVIFGRQQDQAGMRKYINDFRGALSDAEVALFYFKGVTLDASGRNLLMASNAAPGRPIDQSAISLDEIADLMNASQANLLLVDAGLADRTTEALARSGSGLSPTMARLRERSRFMVAFANMPGKLTRSDAESPFAELLASYLTGDNLTSSDLGRKLREDVFERTRGSQLPWVRSDLGAVRLAALPSTPTLPRIDVPVTPAFDRGALIRQVQTELTRHKCYSGSINGNAALAHLGIDSLGRTATGKKSPHLLVASAAPEEFDAWLGWIRRHEQPICAPPPAPPPTVFRPPPQRRVVTQHREPPRAIQRQQAPVQRFEPPRRSSGGGGGGGGSGGGSNPFAPTR
jgi:hypothetical protein